MKRTWKRLTALLLALAMCLSMLSVSAWAAEPGADGDVSPASEESGAGEGAAIVDSGTCGDDATYTLDSDGLLTISGTGAIDDGSFADNTDIVAVVIEDGITAIGEAAFYGCESLTTVTIPDSVTSIGEGAFAYCSLTTVTIPAGVTSIGVGAFLLCQNLTDIAVDEENSAYSSLDGVLFNKEQTELSCYPCGRTGAYVIPDGVTSIGTYAFLDCTGLTAVTIPASVTDLGEDVFSYCANLTAITVDGENSVFSSLDGVLFNKEQTELICCPGGKAGDYVIPDGVTSIADSAFQACNSLTGVTIPASVTSIGAMVFSYCEGLTAITVDGENSVYSSLDGVLFDKEQTELICCPAGKAGAYAVPDTVTIIGESAFEGCTGLTSVTIPDSVATIDAYAFYDCMGLTVVTVGSGVTAIGDGAFMYCENLTDIYYAGSEEDWAAIDIGSDNDCLTDANLHYNSTGSENPSILDSGTCGDNLTWTLDSDYVLTISGTGAMTDWSTRSDVPWYSYRRSISAVTIGDGVTSIGIYAFYHCTGLTDVTIPDSVTSIGDRAFYNCTGLTTVTIGSGVTSIGSRAFYGCESLTAVTIGSGVTTIGDRAFYGCESLTEMVIPDSVTTIGDYVFSGCTGLITVTIGSGVTSLGSRPFTDCIALTTITVAEENTAYSSLDGVLFNKNQTELICCPAGKTGAYVIPDSVTAIGDYAFECCDGLTAVTIPDGVTSIGNLAFVMCGGLTEVTIPDSVTTIGEWAFSYCTALTGATIGSGVTDLADGVFFVCISLTDITVDEENSAYASLDGVLFSKDQTELICYPAGKTGTYVIPDSVTTIGYAAFVYCEGLTAVTIPDSVTTIGSSAFEDCCSLTAVDIPDSVTTIGSGAFLYCTGLTSVTIGSGVTSIGTSAFLGCESLPAFTVDEKNTAYSSLDGVLFNKEQTELICCPGGKAGDYVIPDGVTSIADSAFQACNSLTGVTIPASVTSIGAMVFSYCEGLTAVTIPDSVTSIGDYAFSDCTGLTSVTIGSGVTTIGEAAFEGCESLTDVYYAGSEEDWAAIDIGSDNDCLTDAAIHYNSTGLSSGTCGDNATYTLTSDGVLTVFGTGAIDDGAFAGSTDIVSVVIEDGITAIGEAAFYGCETLTSVTIPDSVTTIGGAAFSYCAGLTAVTIPASVTDLGEGVFYCCTGLTDITVDAENPAYTSLDGVLFDKDQTELICCPGSKAGEYIIPDTVTTIDIGAFGSCTGLTAVTIPASVTSIGDWAFYGCEGLTAVAIPASVTDLGEGVFYYCTSLTAITVDAENPAYSSLDGVLFDKAQTELICCPAGKAGAYAVPDTVTTIVESAFEGCAGLTTVTIPDSVATIDAYAFCDCTGLTTVIMGSGVTSVGEDAFDGCESLTDVYYAGSEEDWAAIDIGSGNDCLTNSTIHYDTTILASGTCWDSLTWTLDSSYVLTISGTGAMPDWDSSSDVPWYSYRSDIIALIIGDGVTTVGERAFYKCTSLTDLTIGSGVIAIGERAFYDCTALTAVTIPDGVTTIGDGAFSGCEGLTAVTIPDSVVTIDDKAFYDCTGLTSVTIGSGVTAIGGDVFYNCKSLTNITVDGANTTYSSLDGVLFNKEQTELICCPAGKTGAYVIPDIVTTIGNDAFYRCTGLTGVTIPASVTSIGDDAFYKCTGLTAVTIPDSVTTIGDFAFAYCAGLTDMVIPDSVTSFGEWTFYNCTALTTVTIGSGVTAIGTAAFMGCESLSSVTIPDSVTSIGNWAFAYCTSLTGVDIPAGVTSIGAYTFAGCTALTAVTIPASVTDIGEDAFFACTSLTAITVERGNQTYASLKGVLLSKDRTELICYPAGKTGAYVIPASVTTIGDGAFYGCEGLTEVTIPASVTSIGSYAFEGCNSLTAITVDEGNSVYASLDGVLFNKDQTELIYCPEGKSGAYIVPDTVVTIDTYAFWYCENLTAVIIPDSVTTIGDGAFIFCTGLTSVVIGNGVTAISNDMFYDCESLTTLVIGSSVTAIGGYAFSYCGSLTDVYYVGSAEDWAAIDIDSSNTYLTDANLHFCTVTVIEPTCAEDGSMTYTCEDGDSYTVVLPATGHNYVNGVCTECGAKEPGAGGGWSGLGGLSTFLTNMMNRVFTRLTNLFVRFR